ncbi:hypothetical protein [Chitinophaga sp.]|uniref:LLM class flavin-dependent oxidoreductase n=1 Tax=Chitinophaga sp. TaxID=1869181 RepID=UPI0031DC3FEC
MIRTYNINPASPLIFLTAVAVATQNIRLITGCVLPAFHHPVKIADGQLWWMRSAMAGLM